MALRKRGRGGVPTLEETMKATATFKFSSWVPAIVTGRHPKIKTLHVDIFHKECTNFLLFCCSRISFFLYYISEPYRDLHALITYF